MARGKTLTVVFKQNNQHQGMLLPPDLSDLIAANHPVRTISAVLDNIDITPLLRLYKPGGTSSYHPRMLLKILVYVVLAQVCIWRRSVAVVLRISRPVANALLDLQSNKKYESGNAGLSYFMHISPATSLSVIYVYSSIKSGYWRRSWALAL